MFTRIVVPLDGTRFAEAALAPARELARVFGARILLVRAVLPHGLPDIRDGDGYQSDLERANDADAYLHGVISACGRLATRPISRLPSRHLARLWPATLRLSMPISP